MTDNAPKILFTGSCLCKNVTYTSTSLPQKLTNCYCTTCRKLSGAPFITFAEIPTASLTFTSGPASYKETSYSDLATRRHCAECGSPLTMQYKCEPDVVGLTASSIDEDTVKGKIPAVGNHIFVDSVMGIGGFEVPRDGKSRSGRLPEAFRKTIEIWKTGIAGPGLG